MKLMKKGNEDYYLWFKESIGFDLMYYKLSLENCLDIDNGGDKGWDVEIETVPAMSNNGNVKYADIPKLDENGCIILKRIT